MKEIDVKPQPLLSAGRTFEIAVAGVRYRLFRAIVTVAVIVVAMAFLMNILTESLIRKSVALSAREQIASLHRVDLWIARLSIAQAPEEIIRNLADEPASTSALHKAASDGQTYLSFFDELPYGRRRVLVGNASGTEILNGLTVKENFARFESGLQKMKSVRFPGTLRDFETFLAGWPDLHAQILKIRDAQNHGIQQVRMHLNGKPLFQALENADGSFGNIIREAGFELPPEEAALLVEDVRRIADANRIEETINNPGIRQAVAARNDMLPGDVTMNLIWDMVGKPDDAAWFIEQMTTGKADAGTLSPERLVSLSANRSNEQLLKRAERLTMEAGSGGGLLGMGSRMTWLALVSMLVCAVGITNAMLMSVTERFREIATLKCLGALDGFIMSVFLIEASFLGLAGGLGGTIVGLVLGFLRMLLSFKSLLFAAFPAQDLLIAAVISIVSGVVLAAAAAVYPSLRAARLAPMEAMRIE